MGRTVEIPFGTTWITSSMVLGLTDPCPGPPEAYFDPLGEVFSPSAGCSALIARAILGRKVWWPISYIQVHSSPCSHPLFHHSVVKVTQHPCA